MLALTDPPYHRQFRSVVDDWFAPTSIRALEPEMRHVAGDVVRRALERESCDFVTDVAARLPVFTTCKILGIPKDDWEDIFALTSDTLGAADPMVGRLAHRGILQYLKDLAASRAKCPTGDVVSSLVSASIDGRKLSLADAVLNCDNLLIGGPNITRMAAAGGMLAFLEHPDEWRALSTEPALLPSAVEEVLRWTSTATHALRTLTKPVVLRDRHIEAGERVTLWNPSANRDESVFADAEYFNVRRHPNRHIALGYGEHFCLGAALARAQLRLLYGELLRNTERIELDGTPVRVASIEVNGLEKLPVKFYPQRRSASA